MLVLSRKSSESIDVGSDIRIKVVAVNGSRVRLGIEAPESLRVLRSELARPDTQWQIEESSHQESANPDGDVVASSAPETLEASARPSPEIQE